MVAVHVGDEHGLQARNIVPGTTKASKGSWGCIDDMVAVEERKGVMSTVGEEGVARSQHLDAVGHEVGTARCFLFSSVGAAGAKDVKRYQR